MKIITGRRVEDVLAQKAAGGFDAVFIAIGAGVGKHIEVPARDASRVRDAVSLLRDVGSRRSPRLGRRVIIYGGGDTAMDAEPDRQAAGGRGGADPLPARPGPTCPPMRRKPAAAEEGLKFRWLTSIRTISGADLTVESHGTGRAGPPPPTGRFETLTADSIVLALGQETDSGFLRQVPGLAVPGGRLAAGRMPTLMTGHAGIFAGGDLMRASARSRSRSATGGGPRDISMRGCGSRASPYPRTADGDLRDAAPAGLQRCEPTPPRSQPVAERLGDFREVVAGVTEPQARYEAQRCLSCGNCFECDNCYAACPEGAIIKLGPGQRYRYDYDKCTGCAVCFEQCPCHAIQMRPEAASG